METVCLMALTDGDYDDDDDIAPGDTALCTECLCKGMHKFKELCTSLEKTKISREFAIQFERLDKNQMKLMKLHYNQDKIGLQ
jgi:hypothetical protein